MLDLERREKFIIIFLLALLLIGLTFKSCKRSDRIIDVKIKSFTYEPSTNISSKVNINEADETALAGLSGVGPALAKRIASYRTEKGRFLSIEELKKVKGIGDKLFDKIKDEVSIE